MTRIDKLAALAREKLGIPDDERPDLLDLLRRLKLVGWISDFGPDVANELGDIAARWDQDTRSIIIANHIWSDLDRVDDCEVRFTIYHELGHVVLNHKSRNRRIDGKPQFGRAIERDELEADDFALAFAIPDNLAPDDCSNLEHLGQRFGLTEMMAGRRAASLRKQKSGNEAPAAAPIRSTPTQDEDWNF